MTNRNRQDAAGKRNRSGGDRSVSAIRKRRSVLRMVLLAGTVLTGVHMSPAYGQGQEGGPLERDAVRGPKSRIPPQESAVDCPTALQQCLDAIEPTTRQETITEYYCRGEQPASQRVVPTLPKELEVIGPPMDVWISPQPVEGAECIKHQYVTTLYDFSSLLGAGRSACKNKFNQCVSNQEPEVCELVWERSPQTGMLTLTGKGVLQGTDETCVCYKNDNSQWIRRGTRDEVCKPPLPLGTG